MDTNLSNPRDCVHGSLARSCAICELEAERDTLKVKLAEAQAENLGLRALTKPATRAIEIEALAADNAALVLDLRSIVQIFITVFDVRSEVVEQLKVKLDQPHPGAPMLSRMADLERENEALGKVEEAAGVVHYDWREGSTPTHLAFERLGKALAEFGYLDNVRRQRDATRNREGR